MLIECPHCGTESYADPEDEEPRCELSDGYLDEIADDEDE